MKNNWATNELKLSVKSILGKINLENEDFTPEVKAYLMKSRTSAGKWKVVITVGLHDWIGHLERQRYSVVLSEAISEKEANLAVAQLEDIFGKMLEKEMKKKDQHDFLDEMNGYVASMRGKIRDNTVDGYEFRLKRIEKYFCGKDCAVEEITPAIIKNFVEWMESEGKDGKPLGYRSVKDTHGLLHGFFKDQIGRGIIRSNPCDGTVLKKRKQNNIVGDEVRWMQLKEYQQFMKWLAKYKDDNACPYGKLYEMIELAMYSGMRKEELLGLRWDAVDLENGHFEIRRTRTRGRKVYDLDNVKSPASHRIYPITEEVRDLFIKLKKKSVEECGDSQYVFSWSEEDRNRWSGRRVGEPYNPDYVNSIFKKMVNKYSEETGVDMSGFTFHKLRHSNASMLFDQGWSLDQVKQWLGHEDVGVTEKIYVHKLECWKDEQAKTLNVLWQKEENEGASD